MNITVCMNNTCPQRGECYRYMVDVSRERYVSAACYEPGSDGECESFLEIQPGDRIKVLPEKED